MHRFALITLITAAAIQTGCGQDSAKPTEEELQIVRFARQIETVLGRNFQAANQKLPEDEQFKLRPRISDAAYLRRATLVLLGRNPTVEETREFLGLDRDAVEEEVEPNRLRLVRKLTETTEFRRQEFRRWLGRFELKPDPRHPAQIWLLTAFEKGARLDEWPVEWLGKYTVPFVAPAAPGSSALDLAKTGVWLEAFLGGQLSCAACHDHPYEELRMEQFMGLAAFLNDQGATRIPESFIYITAKPGDPVPAATFFGKTKLATYSKSNRLAEKMGPEPWPNIGSARQLGEWLVKPESEHFDLHIVNRAWKRVFGVEFFFGFSGMRDRREDREKTELLEALVEVLHAVEHDAGRFLQVLMTTRIAQLENVPRERNLRVWRRWTLTGTIGRELTADERDRSITILETGSTEPALDVTMDSTAFRPEAAWLTSADIERRVTGNPAAAIWETLSKADSDAEALETAYLATLARPPDELKSKIVLERLGAETEDRRLRMARALWALLMSEEFAQLP